MIIFCVGFACGLLSLALLQRQTNTVRDVVANRAPDSLPQLKTHPVEESDKKRRPSLTPQEAPDAALANDASGLLPERSLMDRRIIIPVEGIQAANLQDTFNEEHAGQRHEALDIMAARGTPVWAADAGRVEKLFLSKYGGLTVYQFDESQTYCYYYAHLDHYAPGLEEGMLLRKGEVLGYVGSTGNASPDAPHLHFSIFKLGPEKRWWKGTPIDPYEFLASSSGK